MIQETLQSALPCAISSAFSVAGLSCKGIKWFLDSAAFNHMSGQKHVFSKLKPYHLIQTIVTANGRELPIEGIGTICLTDKSKNSICLPNDLRTGQVIMKGHKQGRLFHLDLVNEKSFPTYLTVSFYTSTANNTWNLWHRRLGHPHASSCVIGKFAKLPFASSTTEVNEPFYLIHCDLWGPSLVLSDLDIRIVTQQSCPGTPEQNGVVEQQNRHVVEIARTLLLESCVPPQFLVEAVHTAVHLINRQTTSTLGNQSPYYSLYHKSPDYWHLRIFGCVCFVLISPHERNKLTAKASKCVFLGYSNTPKGYVCYDFQNKRMRVSRHASDQTCWRKAMEDELEALDENHTWDLVPQPSNTSVIGSKWVYTIKVKADGTLDRYKARLVAQGYK
ncbi:uncharacterized protein LOC125370287 [Ricinus communis]|uniref:uncharacterized protein LOC125370287 n=1 Tax=Ricinus communis TaxID=3988 RepID=UPI00201AEE75|nr:uncharacterized protein LOC125370287 [Ricinus communis]